MANTDPQLPAGYQWGTAAANDPQLPAGYQWSDPSQQDDPSWGEVASGVLSNGLPSVGNLIKNTATPFLHPGDTADSLGQLAGGVINKLDPGFDPEDEKSADAVGQYFTNRYGSMAGFKRALRDDPASVLADASIPFTAGGSLLERAPGIVGKVGELSSMAGKVEPFAAASGAKKLAGMVAAPIIGADAGVGRTPLQIAYDAGKQGGTAADVVAQNMREGGTPDSMLKVVDDAHDAMSQAYKDRSAQFTADMAGIGNTTVPVTPGGFNAIGKAAGKSLNQSIFNGVDFSPATRPVRQQIYDTVVKWGNLDPQTFHTAEGLDKMKREIGEIRDTQQFGTPQWKAANDVYKSVNDEVVKQYPEYAQAMQNYATTSDKLKELGRTLSINDKATSDTTLRKLMSTMSENANFQGRLAMGDELAKYSPYIKEKLAGQSLSSVIPRGISKHFTLGQLGTASTMAAALHNPLALIPAAGIALASSPRLMGEGALLAGRAAGTASRMTPQVLKNISPMLLNRPMLQLSRGAGTLDNQSQNGAQ